LQSSRGVVAEKGDPARIDFITKRQYESRKAGLNLSPEITRLGHRLPFVLNNALGWPSCFQDLRQLLVAQPLPTEAPGKCLRVFRLGEAEHHEVAVIAAHEVIQRGRR
jgi:hypothetical protein